MTNYNSNQKSSQVNYEVKIWPLAMFAAIENKHSGSAARLWFIAKYLDEDGSGKVGQVALFALLAMLKVGGKKRRRWLRDALDLGLFREVVYRNGEIVYRLASWGRGAGMLGCSQIGKPASVKIKALVSPGWRAHVWAAYLATLEGQVISQDTKHRLTGVDSRTQRNYQSMIEVKKIQNYSDPKLIPELAAGVSEVQDKHLFINPKNKKVVQRLPNIIVVPSEVARSLPKGRSRKAQQEINSRMLGGNLSSPVAGPNGSVMRLFHETLKGAIRAARKAEFGEAFWCQKPGKVANQWATLSVEMEL